MWADVGVVLGLGVATGIWGWLRLRAAGKPVSTTGSSGCGCSRVTSGGAPEERCNRQ
ncbi:MAG: hypothetical protein R3B81_08215 [bacterium]